MAISPARAFALGACSILVLAGVFVIGIGIGARSSTDASTSDMDAASGTMRIECPAPPGFTATRGATERVENCETARQVQETLLEAGLLGANVQVSREPSNELIGPESLHRVTAQVYLPDSMRDDWDAEQVARFISAQVGTPIEYVTIVDDELHVLFDGNALDAGVPVPGSPPASTNGRRGAPSTSPDRTNPLARAPVP